MNTLKSDFEFQFKYVLDKIPELLYTVDMDVFSKSYGCAHLAYWRDKTSEFADIRRQEFVLTLALIYKYNFLSDYWFKNKILLAYIEGLLLFWSKVQYNDGSFDEWYKGERAFAGAAFSCFAVAKTLLEIGEFLPTNVKNQVNVSLKKTADWLVCHNDLFKTNHQAVGVCALAYCYKYFNEKKYKDNCYKKIDAIFCVQQKNGWFPEIGGMDIGYTFVTIDYMSMAFEILGEHDKVKLLVNAFDFACSFIQPDITIGKEFGICHNPYVSRIAIIMMKNYSRYGAWLFEFLKNNSIGFKGVSPILADELRFSRWSSLPILAYILYNKNNKINNSFSKKQIPLKLDENEHFIKNWEKEKIITFSNQNFSGIFAPVCGGLLRLFDKDKIIFTNKGYMYISDSGKIYTTNYYSSKTIIENQNETYSVKVGFTEPGYFFPSFLSRLILRILCSTSIGSKYSRKFIDYIRKRKSTALNQSSNPGKSKNIKIFLKRSISILNKNVFLKDEIIFNININIKSIYKINDTDGIISFEKIDEKEFFVLENKIIFKEKLY